MKVFEPHTGNAVFGNWPFTGNVCDQPYAEISIKKLSKPVFTIINKTPD